MQDDDIKNRHLTAEMELLQPSSSQPGKWTMERVSSDVELRKWQSSHP
jgi:hypothetical protein